MHDGYAVVRARDEQVRAALDTQNVRDMADILGGEALRVLDEAGLAGRSVRVQLWVSDPSCGVVIVHPESGA